MAAPAMKWSQLADELGQQVDVAAVALDEAVAGMVVVGLRTGPYLERLSTPDDLMAAPKQLLDHVATNEAGGTTDQNLAHRHRVR